MGSYVKQLKSAGLSSCETQIWLLLFPWFQRGMYCYAEEVNCSWNLLLWVVEEKKIIKKKICIYTYMHQTDHIASDFVDFSYFGVFYTLCLLMQDCHSCIPLNLSVKPCMLELSIWEEILSAGNNWIPATWLITVDLPRVFNCIPHHPVLSPTEIIFSSCLLKPSKFFFCKLQFDTDTWKAAQKQEQRQKWEKKKRSIGIYRSG